MSKLCNIYGETIIEGPEDPSRLFIRAYNEGISLKCVDAEGVNVSGMTFKGLDVSMGKLRKSKFDGCVFQGCNLSQSDLQYCSANKATFVDCNMGRSVLINSRLNETTINSCIVDKITCRGANLKGSVWTENKLMSDMDFSFSNLDNVKFDKTQRLSSVDFGHLASCDGAQFPGYIEMGDFTNSVIKKSNLVDTALVRPILDFTSLIDSNLNRLSILEGRSTNMVILGSSCNDCLFFGEHVKMEIGNTTMQRAKFSGDMKLSNWHDVDLTLSIGLGCDLQNSLFFNVNFNGANVSSSSLQRAIFDNSPLSVGTFNNAKIYQTEFRDSPLNSDDVLVQSTPTELIEQSFPKGAESKKDPRFVSESVKHTVPLTDKIITSIRI
jgi:uncharacterized protein YjbI with pentapeptide repeats